MVKLVENNGAERIEAIRFLYEESFPPDERMPFSRMLNRCEDGIMRLLSVEDENGAFLGFANITLCFDALALNYFAIKPEYQGNGYGSEVILALKKRYPERSIVIDIEDDGISSDNPEQRKRRRAFYERLGFSAMPYKLKIFGVPSLIMSSSKNYALDEYMKIFEQVFSAWALSHVELY